MIRHKNSIKGKLAVIFFILTLISASCASGVHPYASRTPKFSINSIIILPFSGLAFK